MHVCRCMKLASYGMKGSLELQSRDLNLFWSITFTTVQLVGVQIIRYDIDVCTAVYSRLIRRHSKHVQSNTFDSL